MADRFYAPISFDQPTVELAGSEAHHMQRVMRLKVGEQVILFDGNGIEATAEITTLSKRVVGLRILQKRTTPPLSQSPIILATAVPKGDRFRSLVEKVTELGVTRLIPLLTERSVVAPGSGKLDKVKQTMIAACKQSGRNTLMEIDEPIDWKEFLDQQSQAGSLFVAHPSGESPEKVIVDQTKDQPVILVIGPEGGFSDAEIEQATEAGAKLISLGANILRVETAAVALAALCVLIETRD